MTKDELLDRICTRGYYQTGHEPDLVILDELEKEEFVIRCDKINPSSIKSNGCYTYVSNDSRGKELAISLFVP